MKSKGRGEPLLSDLHFVTSLQLEECVARLQGLWRPGLTLDVEETGAPDEVSFRVTLLGGLGTVSEVKGKLRRWQGTRTRVDCSGMLAADQGVRSYVGALLLGAVILMAVSSALTDNPSLLCLTALGALIFLPLRPVGFEQSLYGIVRDALVSDQQKDEARMHTYREMDTLLQEVSGALATPDVEWVEPGDRQQEIAPPIRRHPLEVNSPPVKPFLDDTAPNPGSPNQSGESF